MGIINDVMCIGIFLSVWAIALGAHLWYIIRESRL